MFLYIYVYCILLLIIWLLPMFADDKRLNLFDFLIIEILTKNNQIKFTVIIIVLFIIHKIYKIYI